ncbi:MAG: DUF1326 domain-containing protein [Gemmataceae bacterium]|nr:DUF1326 domain-containing protein [Gemmataceae bacterium]
MMRRFAVLLALLAGSAVHADTIRGRYVEARTCDVWTGPCFANADYNLAGKNAVLVWKIDEGSFEGVQLDGLGIGTVLAANNTLGLEQTGPARAILIVDKNANSQQREALIRFARKQGGKLLGKIVAIQDAVVALDMECGCKGDVCAKVIAGPARVRTRCLNKDHDKACGNESAYHPPLVANVDAKPAGVVEHVFRGTGLNETWSDYERRGAYVGTFAIRN